MNRLNWTLVLVPLALLGLLACQGAAFGDDMDMPLAPLPSGVTAAAYAPPVPAAPAVPTAPSVTVTTPCGACDEGCGCGCDRHWIVGIEALWLAPIGNQRLAGFQTTDHDPLVTDTCIQEEMTFTPRITFGWQGECWGVQAQYFQLRQNDPVNGYGQFGAGNSGGYGAVQAASVRCEQFNLEVTRMFCYGQTQFQFASGLCYGQFDQLASLSVLQSYQGSYVNSWSMSKLDFHGVGVTSGLTMLRPIGCKNLNFFCTAQASLLWDTCGVDESQSRVTWESDNAASQSVGKANTDLFIGEVETGVQWMAPLKCVPADAFFRVAFDYQYWGTGGVPVIADVNSAGPNLTHLGTAAAVAGNGRTGLVGFGISTGITW